MQEYSKCCCNLKRLDENVQEIDRLDQLVIVVQGKDRMLIYITSYKLQNELKPC